MSVVTVKMNESTTLVDSLVDFFVRNEDLRTKSWFLSSSPVPLFTILICYLVFCLRIGPSYMRNRKPYELKYVLIIYNAAQVLLSGILLYEGYKGGWGGQYDFLCQPIDYSDDPLAMRMAGAVWLYYMAKLTELLDTVFFVLRKKQRQVSFLHLWHHTIMPLCGFVGLKYFAGGSLTFLGYINSFIHVIMYTYYMLAALGPNIQKYLWWKRYLTILQIIQFLVVLIQNVQIQFKSNCNVPKSMSGLLIINAAIFIYMFSSFYVRTYIKEKNLATNTNSNNNNKKTE